MNKPMNYDSASAATTFRRPSAGGYVCIITKATDNTAKEYLSIEYDVCEGEFKDHGKDTLERAGWTPFHFNKSYTEKALGYFKAFIEAVEQTNRFTFDWDEKKLVGKGIGLVLQEVEYRKKNGDLGTKLEPYAFTTAEDIRKGNFTVPDAKKLEEKPKEVFEPVEDDGTLPF